jgi:hypothetical protein
MPKIEKNIVLLRKSMPFGLHFGFPLAMFFFLEHFDGYVWSFLFPCSFLDRFRMGQTLEMLGFLEVVDLGSVLLFVCRIEICIVVLKTASETSFDPLLDEMLESFWEPKCPLY